MKKYVFSPKAFFSPCDFDVFFLPYVWANMKFMILFHLLKFIFARFQPISIKFSTVVGIAHVTFKNKTARVSQYVMI